MMSRKITSALVFSLALLLASLPAWGSTPGHINPADSGKSLTTDLSAAAPYTFKTEIILASGPNGPNGPNGDGDCDGPNGPSGPNGPDGGNGGNGPNGPNGDGDGDCDGPNGPSGPGGPNGPAGAGI